MTSGIIAHGLDAPAVVEQSRQERLTCRPSQLHLQLKKKWLALGPFGSSVEFHSWNSAKLVYLLICRG